jgi:hypothetical protein
MGIKVGGKVDKKCHHSPTHLTAEVQQMPQVVLEMKVIKFLLIKLHLQRRLMFKN